VIGEPLQQDYIMRSAKLLSAFGLLLMTALSLLADPPPRKEGVPARENLTPDTFSRFQALIQPQASEWRHLRVRWLSDIVAARKKAAAEDKPIVVLRTGGAGYNDPLGAC
jgi:hypothetical protein